MKRQSKLMQDKRWEVQLLPSCVDIPGELLALCKTQSLVAQPRAYFRQKASTAFIRRRFSVVT